MSNPSSLPPGIAWVPVPNTPLIVKQQQECLIQQHDQRKRVKVPYYGQYSDLSGPDTHAEEGLADSYDAYAQPRTTYQCNQDQITLQWVSELCGLNADGTAREKPN